jgi:hypothetical protein
MVKIGTNNTIMEAKKVEKIQIFPSKQSHSTYGKVMPKLTKTIMSPLTTMPTKNLMIASNILPTKPQQISSNVMTGSQLITNNIDYRATTTPYITATKTIIPQMPNIGNANAAFDKKNMIPSSMNDKQQSTESSKDMSKDRSKETAGYTLREKISMGDVHPYITCYLCKGYLIEATTIVECLHTYCHSCLMKYLCREKSCPQCEMTINKSKTNIK